MDELDLTHIVFRGIPESTDVYFFIRAVDELGPGLQRHIIAECPQAGFVIIEDYSYFPIVPRVMAQTTEVNKQFLQIREKKVIQVWIIGGIISSENLTILNRKI